MEFEWAIPAVMLCVSMLGTASKAQEVAITFESRRCWRDYAQALLHSCDQP